MSSNSSRDDPRVRRTRRGLENALLALAEEQDFASITVGDITRRAEINRNTFYLHYRDKDDLIAQTLDSLFDDLTSASRVFREEHRAPERNTVPPPMIALFTHISSRPHLFRRLLGANGSSSFADRMQQFYVEQFLTIWNEQGLIVVGDHPPPTLRAWIAASAVKSTVSWWLVEGDHTEPEHAAAWAWELIQPLWFEEGAEQKLLE